MSFSSDMTNQMGSKSVIEYMFHHTNEELMGHFSDDPMSEFKVCDYESCKLPASESPMQSVRPDLPVGWRFQPTNEELLDPLLKQKRLGQPIDAFDIQDIPIYDFDPQELLDEKSRHKERYFFCRREFHSKTGGTQKRKRKAKAGYWKRTGKIQSITGQDSEEVNGIKSILVYHNPEPTKYVIHEFEYTAELDSPIQDDNDFVLCKLMIIKKKRPSKKAKAKKKEASKSKKTNPNKRARKGLSCCDTTSVSVAENQKQGKIMANLTFGEGEPSSHKSSDIEYQNSSTRKADSTCGEGERSGHNTSDFEYQNPSDRKAYSASGKGERSYHNTCDFEDQNPSDRKAYPACGEGEPNTHMTSDFEDQNPVLMTTSSICRKGDSSHQGASDFEYQNTYKISDNPIYNIGDTSFLPASDLSNQTPLEINDSDVSRYNLGENSGLVAADLDNQNPNEMTYMSSNEVPYPGCPSSSWVENQNPCEKAIASHKKGKTSSLTNFDFEDDRNENEAISDSCNGNGKQYLVTQDFGNQNPTKNTDILASEVGEWNTLMVAPSDFDMLLTKSWSSLLASIEDPTSQYKQSGMKDMPIPEDNQVPLMAPNTGDPKSCNITDDLERLEEFLELQESQNSAPQQAYL